MANRITYQPNQPTQFFQSGISHDRKIPPASIDYESGVETLVIPPECTPVRRTGDEYGNPQFLETLTSSSSLLFEHGMSKWQYCNRSSAQTILPYLLLGPMNFARDPELVRKAGITMMIAVRNKSMAEKRPNIMNPDRFPSTEGITTATFDIDTAFDALRGRSAVIKAMNGHLEASCEGKLIRGLEDIPGKILIFCETGNERSPILVAMYLMVVWGLDGNSAYQAIQARRFGIGMGSDIMMMLETLTQICKAERNVIETRKREDRQTTTATDTRTSKRSIEATYETDEPLTMELGGVSLPGDELRKGVAPFREDLATSMKY